MLKFAKKSLDCKFVLCVVLCILWPNNLKTVSFFSVSLTINYSVNFVLISILCFCLAFFWSEKRYVWGNIAFEISRLRSESTKFPAIYPNAQIKRQKNCHILTFNAWCSIEAHTNIHKPTAFCCRLFNYIWSFSGHQALKESTSQKMKLSITDFFIFCAVFIMYNFVS